LKAADTDENGQVNAAEFQGLATRWFGEWDADADGTLSAEQLGTGLGKAFRRRISIVRHRADNWDSSPARTASMALVVCSTEVTKNAHILPEMI
jgi:hypothetical protein